MKDEDEDPFNPQTVLIITILIIVIIILLVVLVAVLAKVLCLKIHKVRCHLCNFKVAKAIWMDGSHRDFCARKNQNILQNMPSPFDIRCPRCLAYLKLWPKNLGKSFRCDDSECPVRGKIRNTGLNRLHCFPCDYDICDSCVHRKIFILTKFDVNPCVNQGSENCHLCQLEVNAFPIDTVLPTTDNYDKAPTNQVCSNDEVMGPRDVIKNIYGESTMQKYGVDNQGFESDSQQNRLLNVVRPEISISPIYNEVWQGNEKQDSSYRQSSQDSSQSMYI